MQIVDQIQLGQRLRELRESKRLKQYEIAAHLGVSKQLVNHWENGRSWPSLEHLAQLSRMYESSVDYMIGQANGSKGIVQCKQSVKIFSEADLANWSTLKALPQLDFIVPTKVRSANSIAFHIVDRAMTPIFQPGDLVVVDPDVPAEPGDCVALSLPAEKRLLFRRFKPDREDMKVESPFSLRPDNPDYPTRNITPEDSPKFWGTLVEHVRLATHR